MKAIVCKESGGPEVLALSELPKPKPMPDDLLVRGAPSFICSLTHREINKGLILSFSMPEISGGSYRPNRSGASRTFG